MQSKWKSSLFTCLLNIFDSAPSTNNEQGSDKGSDFEDRSKFQRQTDSKEATNPAERSDVVEHSAPRKKTTFGGEPSTTTNEELEGADERLAKQPSAAGEQPGTNDESISRMHTTSVIDRPNNNDFIAKIASSTAPIAEVTNSNTLHGTSPAHKPRLMRLLSMTRPPKSKRLPTRILSLAQLSRHLLKSQF